ncbi:MAG: hypothetical protein ACKVE4_00405 [Dissulfuribacterales bacterium]
MQYPEIITEMIDCAKSDELFRCNLSSFMSGKSLEDAYRNIDKTMIFFSAYVRMERLDEDIREDKHFVEKREVRLGSIVEAELRNYWWKRSHEHMELINKRRLLKNKPEHKNREENKLRDRAIHELDQEIYPRMIERVKAEYQMTYEDEWEKY